MRYLALISALLFAAAPAPNTGAAFAAAASVTKLPTETATSVSIGAISFAVETPRHTQYLVARIMFEFGEEAEAERFREARKIVWLRDMVLTGVRDVRPNYVTADVDLDVLRDRLEKVILTEVPSLEGIEIALLGRRNVPRR
ncbi:MAG: hypothetical protein AAFU41_06035 [Pseudomonadota bacterium]